MEYHNSTNNHHTILLNGQNSNKQTIIVAVVSNLIGFSRSQTVTYGVKIVIQEKRLLHEVIHSLSNNTISGDLV